MFEREFRDRIEEAVNFLAKKFNDAKDLTKPVSCHSLRTGFLLYDRGYRLEVVLAGFLHDLLEDTWTTREEIASLFGEEVACLVEANSKDARIENKKLQKEKMIDRCIDHGQDALIIKAADIMENIEYSIKQRWEKGLVSLPFSCEKLFNKKPASFMDPIFDELKQAYNGLKSNEQI